MGQHNHTRRFCSQTAAIPTAIKRDSKSRTLHSQPDRRRPQRSKKTRNFNRQTLEKVENRQIEFDLRVTLLLVDDGEKKTKLIIRPLGRRDDRPYRRIRRHRRRADSDTTMPTATPPPLPQIEEEGRNYKKNQRKQWREQRRFDDGTGES